MKLLLVVLLVLSFMHAAGQTEISRLQQKLTQHLFLGEDKDCPLTVNDSGIVVTRPDGTVELFIPASGITAFQKLAKRNSGTAFYELYRNAATGNLPASVFLEAAKVSKDSVSSEKPLAGYRIAIDPGHMAGNLEMARLERKFVELNEFAPATLVEARLTLATALLLEDTLKKLGASVMLTRRNAGPASGQDFHKWLNTGFQPAVQQALVSGLITPEQAEDLQGKSTLREKFIFFNNLDLYDRANLVNSYKPDLVVIMHYNVDVANKPWTEPTKNNFSMAFIPGAFSKEELLRMEDRAELLRLLITDDWEESKRLAAYTQRYFEKSLGVPAAGDEVSYIREYCLPSGSPGVYCRNLSMTRLIHFPLVYGEPLYQDNIKEYRNLAAVDGWIAGSTWNWRLNEVMQCYLNGILDYIAD